MIPCDWFINQFQIIFEFSQILIRFGISFDNWLLKVEFYMFKILIKFSFEPQTFFLIFFPVLEWRSGLGTGFYFGIRYEKVRFYKFKIPTTFDVVPQSFHENQN